MLARVRAHSYGSSWNTIFIPLSASKDVENTVFVMPHHVSSLCVVPTPSLLLLSHSSLVVVTLSMALPLVNIYKISREVRLKTQDALWFHHNSQTRGCHLTIQLLQLQPAESGCQLLMENILPPQCCHLHTYKVAIYQQVISVDLLDQTKCSEELLHWRYSTPI